MMKVSIVTISFNQGRFLEDCILSVLEQDYPDIEYIVVDPGSTDNSRDIIAKYADRISHVVYEPDAGPADGLNNGFRYATGQVLGFINADDILRPGAVSTIVRAFSRFPESDVVFGNGLELDGAGELLQRVWSTPWDIKAHAYRTAVTVQPSTFFRAEIFHKVGGFNIQNRTCWDAELFIDFGQAGARFQSIPDFIGAYRMYEGTVSSEVTWGERGEIFEAEKQRIFEKIIGRPQQPSDRWIGRWYWCYKQLRQPVVFLEKLYRKLLAPKRPNHLFSAVNLVWFGGYPAHYMGELHRRLEERHSGLFFIYVALGSAGPAFKHEKTRLPKKYFVLPRFAEFFHAWRWLNRLDPKAVLITGNFPRGNLVAALWAAVRGRELYYLADSNHLDRRNLHRGWLKNSLIRWMLKSMDKLLYIGSRNRDFYMAQCGKDFVSDHLHFMPLPHNNSVFELQEREPNPHFVFLSLGRLDAVKAVDRVILAYAALGEDAHQKSRLVIAGDGPEASSLKALVKELGLSSFVIFHGSVPSDQVPEMFARCDAVVVASHDEPWGLVVNEALSSGKPVIGPFWIGSFADLVWPGKTGLVTLGNTPAALTLAMQTLLDDPAAAKKMGQAGRLLIQQEAWSLEGSLQSFDRLLADLEKKA